MAASGDILAGYRLEAKIGDGQSGPVWKAVETASGRAVAIKILTPTPDAERLQRLRGVAERVASLGHPGVASAREVRQERGTCFAVMDLHEGETLADRIRPGGLPAADLLALAVPLTAALGAAHESRISHRNLNPDKIRLRPDGSVVVTGFGLAELRPEFDRDLEPDDLPTLSMSREMGEPRTRPYLAPEQVKGHAQDPRTDIFALGTIILELATGVHPFMGDSLADTFVAILKDEPRRAADPAHDPPHDLLRILKHCLEKDPGRRFSSAEDLRRELERARV